MAKKKCSNNNENQSIEPENKSGSDREDGGQKKKKKKNSSDNSSITVVLKTDLHCQGCVSRLYKWSRSIQGVETVNFDFDSNKITVTGKVDPVKVRDSLHKKTKKNIILISPQPKKQEDKDKKKQETEKKPKETPVTTVVIKVAFHCRGCVDRIYNSVSKFKGVYEIVKMDDEKETVTVKGTMDVKALTETLRKRLKRPVEVVPPKKDKGKEKDKDKEKEKEKDKDKDKDRDKDKEKEKDGSGDSSGGSGKKKGGGGGQESGVEAGGSTVGVGYIPAPWFGFWSGEPVYIYGSGYIGQPVYENRHVGPPVHLNGPDHGIVYVPVSAYPREMGFNDENPNACSIL